MTNFTIHIFGYGETQINGDELSIKVKTDTLTKVLPLIDAVWALKPDDSEAVQVFHAVNVFNYNDIRYMTKDGFNVKTTPELKVLIDDLISELKVAFDDLSKTKVVNLANKPIVNPK
jgi:hypothetical protein